MKVFLTSAYTYYRYDPKEWLRSKNLSEASICVDDPDLADIIIFVESHPSVDPYFRQVLNHPLFKKYRRKCVLYHDADLSVTPLPTISPSIESWQYNRNHKRIFHYIARFTENETIDQSSVNHLIQREYLYSFIGSKTHEIREKIFNINHAADSFIKNTTGINGWQLNAADKIIYERDYMDITNKSYFILAPRGIGPCSYRLFEAMQLGRVPVIISDAWVDIPHIDWDKFSIRVPESQIDLIPAILRERKTEAIEMGRLARQYWENHFSPGVSLHHIAVAAKELLKHPYSFSDSVKDYSQFIRNPWHFKNFLRYKKNQLKIKYRKAL